VNSSSGLVFSLDEGLAFPAFTDSLRSEGEVPGRRDRQDEVPTDEDLSPGVEQAATFNALKENDVFPRLP